MARSADGTETIQAGKVPNKQAAIARVASYMAGLIGAGSLVEMSGLEDYEVTEAEAARLWAAGDEVAQRLWDLATRAEKNAARRPQRK